jgi:hypothetical protein
MENSKPTLLWGIDGETGGISALPASPLLLPAIIVLGLVKLASSIARPKPQTAPLPANFNLSEYNRNKTEYNKLRCKIKEGKTLTAIEELRWNTVLPFPSWSRGERWHY